MRRFEHLIVADLSGNLDVELIRCGARYASASAASSLLVVTPPGARMVQSFASVVRAIYERERAEEPRYRVLPDSRFETLLSIAEDLPGDLLLVRSLWATEIVVIDAQEIRRTRRSALGIRQILRKVFSHPEPTFN